MQRSWWYAINRGSFKTFNRAQGQGGRVVQTAGASEANALRGKYFQYFEDLNCTPNTGIEFEGRLRSRL